MSPHSRRETPAYSTTGDGRTVTNVDPLIRYSEPYRGQALSSQRIEGVTIQARLSCHHRPAGTRHRIPDAERASSEQPVVSSSEQMAAATKQILDDAVHGEKPLRVGSGFEAAHLALALPCRLSLHPLAEEPCGRLPIAPRLDENVNDIAILVHGPPQILPPPLNIHEHFVQIPGVAHAAPAVAQAPRVVESERQSPLPNRIIRDSNAALGEKIFDISETQAEPVVEPDGVADDVSGKSVPAIAGRLACHRSTLPLAAST